LNQLTFGLDLLHVSVGHYHGSQGLKLKVTGEGQGAVGLTLILDCGQFSSCHLFMKTKLQRKVISQYCVLVTERHWNMWIPGFGSDEVRPYKRSAMTEAHKQVKYFSYVLAVCS